MPGLSQLQHLLDLAGSETLHQNLDPSEVARQVAGGVQPQQAHLDRVHKATTVRQPRPKQTTALPTTDHLLRDTGLLTKVGTNVVLIW